MKKFFALVLLISVLIPGFSKNLKKFDLHDGFFDADYCLETYYVLSDSLIRVELFGKSGTFNIYCLSAEEKEKPLFSCSDLSDSTGFLLKVDETVYRLNKDKRVHRELRHFENGAQLVYTTDANVRFIIDFSFEASLEDKPADIIKISTYVINLSNTTHWIGLKGIFDTSCGEVAAVHFTTDAGSRIRNECAFSEKDIVKERTVVSSDGIVSFQFVLDGRIVSPVDSVIFANVDELYRMNWDPLIRKGRGFTNNRSYDNSALMIKWPGFTSEADTKTENTFYIAVADNGESPRGLFHVDKLPKTNDSDSEKQNKEPEPKSPNRDKRTGVDFIIPPIRDYQLDPAYIQDLIDKIDALQSSDNVDQKTISRLNAELDAILEKLRRQ